MLDIKEEQRYEQLRKLAQELHIPMPETFLTLEIFDKEGELVKKHKQRSHSWVRNAYNWMFSQLASVNGDDAVFGDGKINVKETSGMVRHGNYAIGFEIENFDVETPVISTGHGYDGYRGAAGVEAGIVVGSGTNAVSLDDYVLQTQIDEGASAGELNHAEQLAPSISWNGGTRVLSNDCVRYFNNNSGGNVDVNEVGIYAHLHANDGHSFWTLVCRDKLGSTVTVPDTGQLKVTYTIQLTYPS
jgi:hypothetical protein